MGALMWWVFATKTDADAAQQAATDLLPDDTLVTGQEAPVQIGSVQSFSHFGLG
jgi:hypothetical protein